MYQFMRIAISILCLLLMILPWANLSLAKTPLIIGQDNIFTQFETLYHSVGIDENNPEQSLTDSYNIYSDANTAMGWVLAPTNTSGIVQISIGLPDLELDMTGYSWDQVKDLVVRTEVNFSYNLEVNASGTGSATAALRITPYAMPWYDLVNRFDGIGSISRSNITKIYTSTVEKLHPWIELLIYSHAHTSYNPDNLGDQYSSAQVNIHYIKISIEGPRISVYPEKNLDFKSYNTCPVLRFVFVKSVGKLPLQILDTNIQGQNNSNFKIETEGVPKLLKNVPICEKGMFLEETKACIILISFIPDTDGVLYQSNLFIESNDQSDPKYVLQLKGTSVPGQDPDLEQELCSEPVPVRDFCRFYNFHPICRPINPAIYYLLQ